MREWNLKAGDPLTLTLAADARLGPTDYSNDQIWEISLGGGEPAALSIQTTFGLRARSFRLFYRFSEGAPNPSVQNPTLRTIIDPAAFASPPVLRQFYPNLYVLSFAPFPGIVAVAEFWVPTSQSLAGRMTLTNESHTDRQVQVELVALLTPNEGERMTPSLMDKTRFLGGKTANLAPVVLLTPSGQHATSPFPALAQQLELPPGASKQVTWVEAALGTTEESFTLAHSLLNRNWDGERARIELLNANQVEIITGDPAWDAAFSFSLKNAYQLFFQSGTSLPNPSFVIARQPDYGYSPRGNGSDYSHLWNGQRPLDAYYLSRVLLPAAPELVRGILRNFLSTATEEGFIDWKPGMGGQRTQVMATPILASLAKKIYAANPNLAFIEEVYPPLLAYVKNWVSPQQDRDEDGIPEWSNPVQSGFEDNPLFAHWLASAQGADISSAESPSLCALLYNECQVLMEFANLLGRDRDLEELWAVAGNLRLAVEVSWDAQLAIYRYWDRDSHFCSEAETLGSCQGPGEILLDRSFEHPVRLLLKVQIAEESRMQVQAFIHGTGANGQHLVERLAGDRFKWHLRQGTATGDRVYRSVERVVIEGAGPEDMCVVQIVDYTGLDHTLLLPLWAGIPAPERAEALVLNTITQANRCWLPYGIPACGLAQEVASVQVQADEYSTLDSANNQVCMAVHLPWNEMICEGLLINGYTKDAAELFGNWMAAIVQSLKKERAFAGQYHALTGQGTGERNSVDGLAPLALFLDILGVRVVSAHQVGLSGSNPFPWPVTVKYQGLTVLRQAEKTTVIFPDGQTVLVTDPAPCVVALE